MSAVPQILNQAVAYHRAGRQEEAGKLYRQVLLIEPHNADSMHLMGLLASEQGDTDRASDWIRRAIKTKPQEPLFYRNLGSTLQKGNRLEQALVCYCKALELQPNHSDTLIKMASALASAGLHKDAVQTYRRALHLDNRSPETLNRLGASLAALGQMTNAEKAFHRAIGLNPFYAEAHSNLGCLYMRTGRLVEASTSFADALRLHPSDINAALQLANSCQLRNLHQQAADIYERLTKAHPECSEAWYQLANTYHLMGRLADAETAYRKTLATQPEHCQALFNLGVTLAEQDHRDDAIAVYQQTLRLQPAYAEAHNNLGNLYQDRGALVDAVECYLAALKAKPDYVAARYNLGLAYQELEDLHNAAGAYDGVIERQPENLEARNNRANALLALGQYEQARRDYTHVLARDQENIEANWNRGFLDLLHGEFEHGWEAHEWRLRLPGHKRRDFPQPVWDGTPLDGRTLLVHAEQGLGDTIQFVRYLKLLRRQHNHVILECQPALAPLLEKLDSVDELRVQGEKLPHFDCHIPLLSLPRVFRTRLNTIPHQTPYLRPDKSLVELWRKRLGGRRLLKVGLVWGGNPNNNIERRRGIPLERFAALGRVDGVALFSLQAGPQAAQLENLPEGLRIQKILPDKNRITDTAAIVQNLDLVVSTDTMMAHLAGALARPVWTLVHSSADWRWLLNRSDSPWYPTMRLFRQQKLGAWGPVIEKVCSALVELR